MAQAIRIFFFFFLMAMSSADLLQNPDFETAPTNVTSNSTSPILLQNGINRLPGWSFNGTVWYVSSGPDLSLPNDGHGVLLGQDGKINQTFRASQYTDIVLTFSLAPGSKNCSNISVAVNVSTPGRFKIFSLERQYGTEMWESHAFYFGSWEDENGFIDLEIKNAMNETDGYGLCGPVVDTLLLTGTGSIIWYGDNLLANNGFEVGPSFLKNSTQGVLLTNEPDQLATPLQQWSVMGTVKYIDSRHYAVPEGKAAIELVSKDPSGLFLILKLTKGSTYSLDFTTGDANDSCVGDLVLSTQVGIMSQNFSIKSNGNGSKQNCSFTFVAEYNLVPISFVSLNQKSSSEGFLCGPVIDDVVLRSVSGSGSNSSSGFSLELPIETILVFLLVAIML